MPPEESKQNRSYSENRLSRKRIISIILTALLLLSLLPVIPAAALAVSGSPGQVDINKTAVTSGNREYTVTLTVVGNPLTTAKKTDIVLILDRSASMAWEMANDTSPEAGEDSRMTVLKAAADNFVDSVLAPGNDNRVAVVSYSGNDGFGDVAWNDSSTLTGFSASAATVKASYAGLTPNGGTNMQAGFLEASSALTGARAGVDKVVIFMTDGMPTFHYNGSGMTEGPGGSFDATGQANAIAAAHALKAAYPGTKIYTVGILTSDVDGNIQNTLNPTVDPYQDGYYHTTTAAGLNEIYQTLSQTILKIASGAVVTDAIKDGFTYIAGSLAVPAGTAAGVTGTPATTEIVTWTIGDITDQLLTLTFRVRAEDPVYGQAFTNEYARINFTPVPENTFYTGATELPFPVPDVPVPPIAVDDAYSVNAGATLTVPAPGVLVNDKSVDQRSDDWTSTPISGSVAVVTPPAHGSLTQNPDGSLTYTPDAGFSGIDTYVYKIATTLTKAGQTPVTLEDTALVTITVNPMTEVTVTKVWADSDDAAGLRPTSVQVQLKQNGVDYGAAVTLNAGNSWSHKFGPLPAGFTYTAVELTVLPAYTTAYSADTFTITNTLNKNKIQVIKLDGRNEQTLLPGAIFELRAAVPGDPNPTVGALLETLTTDAAGQALTANSYAPGQYFLVETKAPDGFLLPPGPILADMAVGAGIEGVFTVRVTNDFDNNPGVTLSKKSANLTRGFPAAELSELYVGETARYSLIITNNGNVALNNVVLTDDRAAAGSAVRNVTAGVNLTWTAGTGGIATLNLGSLAAGASIELTYDYVAVAADLAREPITNTARVTGAMSETPDFPSGQTVSDEDTAVIAVDEIPLTISGISVVKLAENVTGGGDPSDLSVGLPGDTFRFTVMVSNTGNLGLSLVQLTDDQAAVGSIVTNVTDAATTPWLAGAGGIATISIGDLAPGQSKLFTYEYTSTEADIGLVLVNKAVAKGTVTITLDDPAAVVISDEDTASIGIDEIPLSGESSASALIGLGLLAAAAALAGILYLRRRCFNANC